MEKRFNIEEREVASKLKGNPFTLPNDYLSTLKESLHSKITKEERTPFWQVVKPQLALVSTFAAIFLFGYLAITVIGGTIGTNSKDQESTQLLSQEIDDDVIDLLLMPRAIDFITEEEFLDNQPEGKITLDQLIAYLEEDIDLVTLSTLDF